MARLQITPTNLTWGRLPNGEFCINRVVHFQDGKEMKTIILESHILTKEEEASLNASMMGLVMPTVQDLANLVKKNGVE